MSNIDFNSIDWSDEITVDADSGEVLDIPAQELPEEEEYEQEDEVSLTEFDDDEFMNELEEEPNNLIDVVDSASDDDYFHFGDDVKLTKKQIRELAKREADIRGKGEFIDGIAQSLQRNAHHQDAIIARSVSETERRIEYYESLLSDPSISEADEGKYARILRQERSKLGTLNADAEKLVGMRKAEELMVIKKRVAETDDAMAAKYGQAWAKDGMTIYNDTMNAYGISKMDIAQSSSPGLAQAFIDARKWRLFEAQNKQKTAQEVKKLVARSSAKNKRSSNVSQGAKDDYIRKISSGTASKKDLSKGFAMIDWNAK